MGLVSVDPSFELLNLTCWQDRNMGYIHYVDLGRSWLSVRNEDLPDKIEPLRLGRSHGMRVGPDALAPFSLATRERGPGGRRRDGCELQCGLDGRTKHAPRGRAARRYRGDGTVRAYAD